MSLLERLEVARPSPALTLCPIYNDSDGSLEVGDSLTPPPIHSDESKKLMLDCD